MSAPLVVLGVLSVVGGVLGIPAIIHMLDPVADWLPNFLSGIWPEVTEHVHHAGRPAHHSDSYTFIERCGLLVGAGASILGVVIGWRFWGHKPPERLA